MRKEIIILIILFFVSTSTLANAGVSVDKTSIDCIAGETIVLDYTITGTGPGSISFNITPDSIGFNITCNNSFIAPLLVPVVIKTNPFLMPGSYNITATITTEYESTPVVHHTTHHVTVIPPVEPIVINTTPSIPVPPVNLTRPALPPPTIINPSDDNALIKFIVLLSIIILLPFMVLFVYIYWRTHKKK